MDPLAVNGVRLEFESLMRLQHLGVMHGALAMEEGSRIYDITEYDCDRLG